MKKVGFVVILAIVTSAVVMAFKMYDDGIPPRAVRQEFRAMYPDSKDVEWDSEGTYWSVSFETGKYPARVEHEALFSTSGKWIMTETKVFVLDVPKSVREALANNAEYGSLPMDDNEVEYYQTPNGNFWRFDMVSAGHDIDVDVSEDGTVSLAKRNWF